MNPMTKETAVTERTDLLAALGKQRYLLRFTTRDMTDEQAREHPTVSELCLGGVIKHVTTVERNWAGFIVRGPAAMGSFSEMTEQDKADWLAEFQLRPDETLAQVLDAYARTAARTDQLVTELPDLDVAHPLPEAPWYAPGESWSARRVLLHIIAETAQHAGHADIIRESLDGAKTMG